MRSRNRSTSFPTHSRPPGARLLSGLLKFCLVLGLVGVALWLYFQSTVRSKLAGKIEETLNELVVDTGLHVAVGQAQFIDGKGIALSNLRVDHATQLQTTGASAPEGPLKIFSTSDRQPPIVDCYAVFLHMPVCLTEIVLGKTKPQGVEIRRARINLVRDKDGQWELGKIIQAFQPKPDAKPIPITVRDSEIRVVDNTRTPPLVRRLTDVQIDFSTVQREGRELTQVAVRCKGSEVGQFQVTLLADPATADFDVHFATQDIRLSPALFGLLPERISDSLASVKALTGSINLEGRTVGNLADEMPQFIVTGHLNDFSIDDTRLPAPLTRAGASFLVSNEEVRFSDARGRIGDGSFHLNYQQSGLLDRKSWVVDGDMQSLDFQSAIAIAHLLPKGCGQFCRDFSPQGKCDLDFRIGHDGQRPFRTANARLKDTSFKFVKFPYYVDQCVGTVDVKDDVMKIDMKSFSTLVPMTLKGTVLNPGMDATYELNIAAPGELPIDDKLLEAIDAIPAMSRVVRNFRPTGRVGGTGTIIKRVPRGDADKFFEVDLKGVAIRHTAFAYPIRNITGRISAANLDFKFRDLVGSNGTGGIRCQGSWNPREGLLSNCVCQNVNLDSQLRIALSPQIQEIWNGFRPNGTAANVAVEMTMPPGQPAINVVVDADLENQKSGVSNVSIFPYWFPYQIKELAGNVKIGNGQISVKRINGKHDRVRLSCEGTGRYSDESWSVTMSDLLATSVSVDEQLLTALPTSLAPPMRQMKYEGLLNVEGEITVAGVHQQINKPQFSDKLFADANYFLTDPTMAWNLNFSMNNAKMLVGLPLEGVFGQVQLQGIYDGKRTECQGEVALDSLSIYGAQITQVSGPLWLDNDHVSTGSLVSNSGAVIGQPSSTGQSPDDQKRSLTGNVYGGVIKLDATMKNDKRGEFYIQTTLADGDIRAALRDFAPGVEQVEGRGFVAMRMGGEYASTHSYKGDGTVQLRDAKIYELPAILALLKRLNVGRGDRSAFDSSNVDFKINGTDIDFDRIELTGDAISLIGNGRANLNQDLDLNFYSVVGRNRNRIPLLNEIYHAGSQQILWLSVDGTVSNPRMSRQVLPHLNDSLKQLFQTPGRQPVFQNRIERTADRFTPAGNTFR